MNTRNNFEPFSDEAIEHLFQVDLHNSSQIVKREIDEVEFKENFNWNSLPKYARVMASYANNNGGYIIFGIKDATRELIGMKNDKFDRLKPEKFGNDLNNIFAPSIKWDLHTHVIGEKRFGLIYTYKASNRPIVAYSNVGDGGIVRDGDIFYRYAANTERIKYPELSTLINERQESQLEKWLSFLQRASKIGIDGVALLDFKDGQIIGNRDRIFISEDLLDKIKFIQEGSFSETDGEPTLRVIGDVETTNSSLIQPVQLTTKVMGIHAPDIISAFLNQVQVQQPRAYLEQMCFSTTGFLPVYYFMQLAEMTIEETIALMEAQTSRMHGKDKLLNRLRGEIDPDRACNPENPSADHPSGAKALHYNQQIISQVLQANAIPNDELRFALRAFRMLEESKIDLHYVLALLKELFNQFYADKSVQVADDLRRAVCYLDCLLYRPKGNS